MSEARQFPPPSQSKKRAGPDPPPPVDGNTSTKRTKVSEPGGLVSNWKKKINVGPLEHIACKRPIKFIDDEEDNIVEGEFDRAEEPDTLNAVRASKPSIVRVESKLVRLLSYLIRHTYQTVHVGRHETCPAPLFLLSKDQVYG